MNVKFLIRMTTVPAAAVGIAHSPVIGSGPVAGFSEKQLANGRLAAATAANAVRAAVFRERNRQLTVLFRRFDVSPLTRIRRLPVRGARARGQCANSRPRAAFKTTGARRANRSRRRTTGQRGRR